MRVPCDRRVRGHRRGRFLDPLRARLTVAGLTTGAACFAALLAGHGAGHTTAPTMVFVTLVAAKLLYVFSVRGDGPAWRAGRNRLLGWAVGSSAAVAAAVPAVPALRSAFGAVELSNGQLLTSLGLATLPFLVGEGWKRMRRSPRGRSALAPLGGDLRRALT